MPTAVLDRAVSAEHDALVAVSTPALAGAGWLARTWYGKRQASRAVTSRAAAIDRTAARVERADQLDRLEAEVGRKDARIAQLEADMAQMRSDLNALAVEVARYRAGLVAPNSYVLVPSTVVAAIRATHPGALPAIYPGEDPAP